MTLTHIVAFFIYLLRKNLHILSVKHLKCGSMVIAQKKEEKKTFSFSFELCQYRVEDKKLNRYRKRVTQRLNLLENLCVKYLIVN